MLQRLLAIAFVLSACAAQAQDVTKCDRDVLLQVDKWMGSLSQADMMDFFLTFGPECRNNAEYTEWSNELLFKMLHSQTDLTIRMIEKYENQIEINEILNVISSPINDGIDISGIIARVEKVKVDKRLKVEIVDRLNLAAGRL